MRQMIDVRNVSCPGPVIKAKNVLKDMDQGTLEVLVDNFAAVQNLTKLASYLKVKTKWEQYEENDFKVIFQAGRQEEESEKNQEPIAGRAGIRKGCVVAISADHMGQGDEALGKTLMKGFIYALTELEQLPETLLFYNGGARMVAEGSESVEDLKLMESQGVKIMTCGACLNHYGLSEHLSVGTVTNMYAIAELITGAERVVRP